MIENLLIGGLAGVISRSATAPLELYKIQRQNSYLKESNIRNVIKREGLRHLWKGNMTNSCRVFPQFAINYAIYEQCKIGLFKDIKDRKMQHFYSGGIAGVGAMVLIYPMETIRTRLSLQMNKSHYSNPIEVVRKLSLNQLYRGIGISVLGFGPFSAFNFMFFNLYSDYFQRYVDPTAAKLLAGGFAGMSSITLTYPTDLLRRHFQMADFSPEVPKYNGILHGFQSIIKNKGFSGLYQGLIPTYIRIFPCLAIQFWCLEKGKSIFDNIV
jgi:hypothetical protein